MRGVMRICYVLICDVRFLVFFLPKDNVPAEQEQSLAFVRDLASAIFYGGIIKG